MVLAPGICGRSRELRRGAPLPSTSPAFPHSGESAAEGRVRRQRSCRCRPTSETARYPPGRFPPDGGPLHPQLRFCQPPCPRGRRPICCPERRQRPSLLQCRATPRLSRHPDDGYRSGWCRRRRSPHTAVAFRQETERHSSRRFPEAPRRRRDRRGASSAAVPARCATAPTARRQRQSRAPRQTPPTRDALGDS